MGKLKPFIATIALLSGLSNISFAQAVVENKQPPITNLMRENVVNPFIRVPQNPQRFLSRNQKVPAHERIATSPLDSCSTYTYRLKIGTDNSNEEVTEITSLSSKETVLTGKTDLNGNQDDALLVKLDANGNVTWTKTYGDNTHRELFSKARETSDGGLIVVGTVYDANLGSGSILVCKTDINGNLQWTRKLAVETVASARGADIIELADKQFAFLGDDGKNLIYGKLASNGNLLWDQQIKVTDSTYALNIVEDYDGWILASAGMEGGWHVSNILKVDSGTGNLIWCRRFGGSSMNANFIFQKVEFINLRSRIAGIYAPAGQPYRLMRINVNTGSAVESIEDYAPVGVPIDTTASVALTPWDEAVAFSANSNTNVVAMFENIPDPNVYYPMGWANNYTATANLQVVSIEKAYDAGLITVCNLSVNSRHDILLIKVDSAGMSPGCDPSPLSVNWTMTVPVIPVVTVLTEDRLLSVDATTIPQDVVQFNSTYNCRQLTCPQHPIEDSCLVTFIKTYRSYNFCDISTGISATDDDRLIVSGLNRENPYDPSSDRAILLKTDNKGNLLAKKRLLIGENCVFIKQIRLADNNFLAMGYYSSVSNPGSFFILKFDKNLNFIWTKTYVVTETSWNLADITEELDGSVFVGLYYHDFVLANDRMGLLKLDAAGNFIWHTIYRSSGPSSYFAFYGALTSLGSKLYFMSHILYEPDQRWNTVLTAINPVTGALFWSKRYSSAGHNTEFLECFPLTSNSLYLHGFVDLPTESYQSLMKVDESGNILKLSLPKNPVSSLSFVSTRSINGDLALAGTYNDYSATQANLYSTFLRLDSNLLVKASKKMFTKTGAPSVVTQDQQGYIFATGYNYHANNYNADFFITKYSPDGVSGTCSSDSFQFQQGDGTITATDQGMTTTVGFPVSVGTASVIEIDYSLQQNSLLCGSASDCDSIWLDEPGKICDSTTIYTFFAHKNSGCTAPVGWVLDTTNIRLIQKNDSLIRMRFLKNKIVSIKAQLFNGCRIFEDSIEVEVKLSPANIYLGPDTSLCPQNSLLLNAHAGFATYVWQDGSADSVFTVKSPGNYYVIASNYCNVVLSDSVIVSPAPPIDFELGPNLIKCNTDSLTVTAPPGFLNYLWSPGYDINQTTGQSVVIFPAQDTVYYVAAEKTPGCFAYDSIRVKVNRSSAIDLGPDASFCTDDSLVLKAPDGFVKYNWNTGADQQQITIFNSGDYNILATDAQLCTSRDTLDVIVYENPSVNLGEDIGLCQGTNLTLDVGAGFNEVIWSTGSMAQMISVATPGTYWVSVTDNHNCKGVDTMIVIRLNPSPTGFLSRDTTICSYSTIELEPLTNFKNYLWSNGSTAKTIAISDPGLYWLQVTDISNCTGRDTVQVDPKQCNEGFFIANAFTPNEDGKNDVFRPLLFGNVLQYKFMVFDRWGTKVFESHELGKGWDGRINGLLQSSFVYVWECSYQFEGGAPEIRKGTVTLLR